MMKQEVIKPIIRVGNSAGVILPREWLNGKAKVELIESPLDIKKEIFEILSIYLDKTIGIYIVGSYARGEEKAGSDIDILGITENINLKIKRGKYNIILISKNEMENELESNALPIIPMLNEAKAIINPAFLSKYKNSKLTQKNLKFHIETTKSALRVAKEFLNLGKEKVSDNIMYSLILRLREVYIVASIKEKNTPTNHGLTNIIKKLCGDEEAYYSYTRAKDKPSRLSKVNLEAARKIYEYIKNKITEQEKWIRKEKNS